MHEKQMPHKPDVTQEPPKPLYKRLGWLVVIYAGSIVALGIFAMLIKLFMTAAGMKSH